LAHMDNLPFMGTLSLLLGFTAQTTMKRWMDIYWLLVWPENAAIMFNSFFYENALPPDKARVVRHSVYRYLLLTYILLLRDVSIPVRKQFPTYNHLIEGKLLTEEELDVMEHANIAENSCRYWQPMLWTILVLKKYYRSPLSMSAAQRSAMDEVHFGNLVEELSRMRGKLGDILSYDWVPIPLASTQTITFAVYCYLVINGILQHYPLCLYTSDWSVMAWATRFAFSLLLNTFYLGWLKCSQVMVNPFGLDDDDFEVRRSGTSVALLIFKNAKKAINSQLHCSV
uniref:Bestrophin homolog n=1 Tax=Heligmosomoides polygyrus TaxID=6339 RepID=A0A8L8KX68_HELPZ